MTDSLQSLLGKTSLRLRNLSTAATQRHNWSPEEIVSLVNKYRDWSRQTGPDQTFSLKDFILSTRGDHSFFADLPDEKYYERIKRTLYRALSKAGVAWKHAGKKRLRPEEQTPEIASIVRELEQHGVAIATDGAVLLVFPTKAHQLEDGYFVPTVSHAITHLRNIITNTKDYTSEIVQEAKIVIPLLQQFVEAWKKEPEKEKLFDPNIKNILDTSYEIKQDTLNPHLYEIKKADGTIYTCNLKNHSCTCPAGQSGRPCKHLSTLLFKQ